MGEKILLGVGVLALLTQVALAWMLYRWFAREPLPDVIDPFWWGCAAIGVSLAGGLGAVVGGMVMHRRTAAVVAMVLGLAAIGLSLCEAIMFGFIYLVGKGNPR